MIEVSEGWQVSTVGECFLEIKNGTPATQNKLGKGVPVSRIETIQNNKFDLNRVHHIETPSEKLAEDYKYREGDIAFSHINSFEHVGKTALYEGNPEALIHGMNLLRLRRKHEYINPKFAHYFMRSTFFREEVRKRVGHAVNQVSINQKNLSEVPFVLAPLNEQRRIVAKLEKLLSRVDAAQARLATIPRILKRFRQSVLAAACSGELTVNWRQQNIGDFSAEAVIDSLLEQRLAEAETASKEDKLRAIYEYKEENASEDLPEGWNFVALGKLCESFDYGTSAKSQSSGVIPVLRMGNIQNGEIDWSDLVYTSDEDEIDKYSLEPQSVLFNRTNSPELVGKTAIYRGERPAIFAGYLIRVNNFRELNSAYLNYCLNTNSAREFRLSVKTDGVSQSNINAQKLAKFEVPFCSLAEQQEIVRRVEALFKTSDALEARYRTAKAHVDKLTQSILARAFRGELVTTEAELARREGRDYEPASVLLERIRRERAQQASSTKPKPKQRRAAKKAASSTKLFT
jgi:type I restriction enzyme S subunit